MKQCEICEEFSATMNFSTDIRMTVCDDCLIEMQTFIALVGEFEEC